jgi:hypothetical protein
VAFEDVWIAMATFLDLMVTTVACEGCHHGNNDDGEYRLIMYWYRSQTCFCFAALTSHSEDYIAHSCD